MDQRIYELCDDACPGQAISLERAIRAVIADEREAAKPESAADAGVPESPRLKRQWCLEVARHILEEITEHDVGTLRIADMIGEAAESEIARRVAEAVAEKDKRIEVLTSCKWTVEAACKALGIDADGPFDRVSAEITAIREASAAKDKRIAFVENQCSLNLNAYHEMTAERDALKQQLDASQAEVERLKVSNSDFATDMRRQITNLESERAKLRDENARLSRPVEGVDWKSLWDTETPRARYASEWLREVIEPLLQAERNARESAEAERDEMREFVRTHDINRSLNVAGISVRSMPLDDADLDTGLAIFRAEKAKVRT